MFEYLLIGSGFAFAAVIQPGPLQAYLLNSVAQNGWKRTLPAAFAPLISDGPIVFLALFVLTQIPEGMNIIIRGIGGVFLIYLAWRSYQQWKRKKEIERIAGDSAPRKMLQAAMVNLLNPNPYLGWSLVMGPAMIEAWNFHPPNAVALIVAFYVTIILGLAVTILLLGTTRVLGAKSRHTLILVSAVVLLILGIYQITASLMAIRLV